MRIPVSQSATGSVSFEIDSRSENFREYAFCSIFDWDKVQPRGNDVWWRFRVNSFVANSKFINFTYRYHEDAPRQDP